MNIDQPPGLGVVFHLVIEPHIQHGDFIQMLLEPLLVNFRHTRVGNANMSPAGFLWKFTVLRTTTAQIGGDGLVDQLRMRQFHRTHVLNKIGPTGPRPDTRIECFFFTNGTDCAPLVVVRRINQAGVRQGKQLARNRVIQTMGTALLKITATTPADQQGIPGENH